ncbi:MAG: hypothetical protein RLZZ215_403 [Pseudomonadota bacterium]|jgi:hypothetical protein
MNKLKTDWIRACIAGRTVDGREITEQQIQDMASSYTPEVYLAHIWPEHIRGIDPSGVFKSLGDVLELKAERIKGGALDGVLALYAILEPHPDLVTIVRNGQKVHLSVEIEQSFADTGKAYLMGLGVTDSPASLGTGLMHFNAQSRHTNLFSTPLLCDGFQCHSPKGHEFALILESLDRLESLSQRTALAANYATRADFERLEAVISRLDETIHQFGEQEVIHHGSRPETTGVPPDFERSRFPVGY